MVQYKLICFYSEGPPNDNGLRLGHCKEIVTNSAKDYFDEIIWYTPTKLREMGYDYYVKEREPGLVNNSGMSYIGNCAWRPLIMLLELEKMQEGDILVYRDCKNKKQNKKTTFYNVKDITMI